MIETTAKELLNSHRRRLCRIKRKEQENSTTEDAKENFRRKPYMGLYRKRDQCGNDPGGR